MDMQVIGKANGSKVYQTFHFLKKKRNAEV